MFVCPDKRIPPFYCTKQYWWEDVFFCANSNLPVSTFSCIVCFLCLFVLYITFIGY